MRVRGDADAERRRGAFRLTPRSRGARANATFPWTLWPRRRSRRRSRARWGSLCGIGTRGDGDARGRRRKAAADAAATLAALGLGEATTRRRCGGSASGRSRSSVARAGVGWWLVSTTTPRGWRRAARARERRRRGGRRAAETFDFLRERRERGGAVDFVAELVLSSPSSSPRGTWSRAGWRRTTSSCRCGWCARTSSTGSRRARR